jgi:sugar lactone lactonase YvrE
MNRFALSRLAALAAFGLLAVPAAEARSTPRLDRPPLPRTPPTGPAVDGHLERLPADLEPQVWTDLPPRPALDGPLAVNDRLTRGRILGENRLSGAEDIALGLDGRLYTGTADGSVWRITVDRRGRARSTRRVARLRSRVLGLAAYSRTIMVAAQPGRGVIALNVRTGRSWVLADRLDGNLIFFPDAVAIARDGTIYFSEASTVYYPGFPNDFLDGRPNGRLLRYEPTTGRTSVVADELYFANGVQVDSRERYVLVAESFRFRLVRVQLNGPRAGTRTQFGPPLINGPDNIHLDARGRVWVGGSALRSDLVDAVLTSAELRRQLAATPPEQQAAALPRYGFALVLDRRGQPIYSFHDPSGRYFGLSAALPHRRTVTFGSLTDNGVAQLPMPAF